jgi:hypothetical protein
MINCDRQRLATVGSETTHHDFVVLRDPNCEQGLASEISTAAKPPQIFRFPYTVLNDMSRRQKLCFLTYMPVKKSPTPG